MMSVTSNSGYSRIMTKVLILNFSMQLIKIISGGVGQDPSPDRTTIHVNLRRESRESRGRSS